MESSPVVPVDERGTGSSTIADLIGPAAERTMRSSSTRCASGAAAATPAELAARAQAVTREQPYAIIYTSGTTGPPTGCMLSHANHRDVVSMCGHDAVVQAGDVAYAD